MDCDPSKVGTFFKSCIENDDNEENHEFGHTRLCQCRNTAKQWIERKSSIRQGLRSPPCQRHFRRRSMLAAGTSSSMSVTIAMLGLFVVSGTTAADSPGFCNGKAIGYYADLTASCQDFHVCDGSLHHKFKCPEGTIFDERHQICDWKTKVVCPTTQSNPIQPPNQLIEEQRISFQQKFPKSFIRQKVPQNRPHFENQNRFHSEFNQNNVFSQRTGLLSDSPEEVPNKVEFSEPNIKTHRIFTKKLKNQPEDFSLAVQKPIQSFNQNQQKTAFVNQFQQNEGFQQPARHQRPNHHKKTLINPFQIRNHGKFNQERTTFESNGLKVKEGPRNVLIFGNQPHQRNPFVPRVDHVWRIPDSSTNFHNQENRRHFENNIFPDFQTEAEDRIMHNAGRRNEGQFGLRRQRKNEPTSDDHDHGFHFETGFEPMILPGQEDFDNKKSRSLKHSPVKRPEGLEDHVVLDMNRFTPPEPQNFELSDAREGPPPSLLISRSGQQRSITYAHQLSHKQEDVALPFTGFVENQLDSQRFFPAEFSHATGVKSETESAGGDFGSSNFDLRREKRDLRADSNNEVVSSDTKETEEISTKNETASSTGSFLKSAIKNRSQLLEISKRKKAKQKLKDYLEKKLKETIPTGNIETDEPTTEAPSDKEQLNLITGRFTKTNHFKPKLPNLEKISNQTINNTSKNAIEDLKKSGSTVQNSPSTSRVARMDPVSKLLQFQKEKEEKEAGKAKVAEIILNRRLDEARKLASHEDNTVDEPSDEPEDRSDEEEGPRALPLTIKNHGSRQGKSLFDNKFQSRQLEVDQGLSDMLQPPPLLPQPPRMLFPFISPSLLPFLTPPLTDQQREAVLSRRTRNFEVSLNNNNQNHEGNQIDGHETLHPSENEQQDNEIQDHFHQDNDFQAAGQASTASGSEEFQPVLTNNHDDVRRDDRFVQNEFNEELIVEPHSQPNRRASGDEFFVNGPKMMFRVKVIPHMLSDEGNDDDGGFLPDEKLQSHHPALHQQQQAFKKKKKAKKPHDNLFNHAPASNFDEPTGSFLDSSPGQEDEDVNKEVDQFIETTGQNQQNFQQQQSSFNNGRPSVFLNAFSNFNNGNFRPGLGNFRPSRLQSAAHLRPGNVALQQLAFDHQEKLSNVGSGKNQGFFNERVKSTGSKKSQQSFGGNVGTLDDFGGSQGIPGSGQDFHNPNHIFTQSAHNHPSSFGSIDTNFGHPKQSLFGQSKILNGLFQGLQSLGVGHSQHHPNIPSSSSGFSDNDPDFIFRRAHHQGRTPAVPVRLPHKKGLVGPPGRVPLGRPLPGGLPPLNRNVMAKLIGGRNLRRSNFKVRGQHPAFLPLGIRRMSQKEHQPVPGPALRPPPFIPTGSAPARRLTEGLEQTLDRIAVSKLQDKLPSRSSVSEDDYEDYDDDQPPPAQDGGSLHFHIHTVEKNEGAPPSSEGQLVSEAIKPTRFGGDQHEGFVEEEEDTGDNSIDQGEAEDDPGSDIDFDLDIPTPDVAFDRRLLNPFTLFRQHTEKQGFAQKRKGRANSFERSLKNEVEEEDKKEDAPAEDESDKPEEDINQESSSRENKQETEVKSGNVEEARKSTENLKEVEDEKPTETVESEETNEIPAKPAPTLFREFIRGKSLTGLRELPKALHALLTSKKDSS